MTEDSLLMIPGPTSIERGVREAMTKEMISHRSETFERVYRNCREGMEKIFRTDGDVVFINATGTAAMEAGVSNVVDGDDTVVCLQNGKFGEKFEWIASRHTSDVRPVRSEWGHPLDLDALKEELSDNDVAAVTMVHTETSCGVTNPVEVVGDIVSESDAVLLVDCVTSAGSEPLEVDEWNVDMAVTAPQKSLGAPPGISAITLSDFARTVIEPETAPYYLDLDDHLSRRDQTPSTSPVQVFWGLQEAVDRMQQEGVTTRIDRYDRLANTIREATAVMGLSPYPTLDERTDYAKAVSCLSVPDELHAPDIVAEMEERGVVIRTGLGHIADHSIRIGTMGSIGATEVLRMLRALQGTLRESSFNLEGDGVAVAESMLDVE